MSFTRKDMKDLGKKLMNMQEQAVKTKKYYPSVNVDSSALPELDDVKVGDKVTLHAHGRISSTSQYNDEPKNVSIELEKGGVKPGHNPTDKWIQGAKLKEGNFTAYCKAQGFNGVTAECIAHGKRSPNTHVRKMAVLAGTFRRLAKKR